MERFYPGACQVCDEPVSNDEVLVVFRGELLVIASSGRLPSGEELPVTERLRFGRIGARSCSCVELPPGSELPESLKECGVRGALLQLSESERIAVCRARELAFWRRCHRFCGRCGRPLRDLEQECALRCDGCGALYYPQIAPAVIVAIRDGEGRLLFARNSKFRPGMYSVIAGFVEAGESLEEAIHREVAEEVGLRVGELRYFGSQPWPYPNSLMVAFTARCDGGVPRPDGVEITDARFCTPEEMPPIPEHGSIAREMIDDWLANYGKETLR